MPLLLDVGSPVVSVLSEEGLEVGDTQQRSAVARQRNDWALAEDGVDGAESPTVGGGD
jgi:hypothetical protein